MGVSGDDVGALERNSGMGSLLERVQIRGRDRRSTTIQPTQALGPRPDERVGMDSPDAAVMQVLYAEHAAALWRYALRLTGDQVGAEDVVQETLVRACQHSDVIDDRERSAPAWLFTVARHMIIDERRSSRFRNEVSSRDGPTISLTISSISVRRRVRSASSSDAAVNTEWVYSRPRSRRVRRPSLAETRRTVFTERRGSGGPTEREIRR